MKYISILFFLLVSMISAQNLANAEGRFNVSAKAAGYGGAFTALANDASASYWNAAALAKISNYSLSGMTSTKLSYDRKFSFGAAAYNLGMGVIGVSFTTAGVDNIQEYTSTNQQLGTFSVGYTRMTGSYAFGLSENLSVGGSIVYLEHDLHTVQDKGMGVDIAAHYKKDGLHGGFVIQNLMGKFGPDDLPKTVRLGLGIQSESGLVVLGELVNDDFSNSDSELRARIGGGFIVKSGGDLDIALRTGIEHEDLNFGFGIEYKTGGLNFGVDYAYVSEPSEIFDASHRIGFTIVGF